MAPRKRMQLWPFEKEKEHFSKKLCQASRHIEEMRKANVRQNGSMRRMQIKVPIFIYFCGSGQSLR